MRSRRLLVAYSYSSTFVTTTRDYIDSFRLFSDWDVHYVHVTEGALMDFDLSAYDAIFHNYCARFCFDNYVSASYRDAVRRFQGVKVIAIQDEYDFTHKVRQAIADIGFDIVLTCVPEESWDYVYPSVMFPRVDFIQVLTGYVPDTLVAKGTSTRPLAERPILIGYRGRDIGARYGRLGFEKFEIGRRMEAICAARGLAIDIASGEDRRIYGDAWFDFLGSCRATLGSESGSNVFDFHGRVASEHEAMSKRLGRAPTYAEFEPCTRELEAAIEMGQISPRVFEAAVMRTPMILLEGRYSGVVEPEAHYIPLKKDYSNVDDVLKRLADIGELTRMAERAYDHLVASGRYSYPTFVKHVMTAIERRLANKPSVDPSGEAETQTPEQLAQNMGTRPPFVERPTTAPLSRDWYWAMASLRIVNTFATDLDKMAGWARREVCASAATGANQRTERLDDIDRRGRVLLDRNAGELKAAFASQEQIFMTALTDRTTKELRALTAEAAEIALDGKSWLPAPLAKLRAPWVEADIPALAWAKRFRQLSAKIPGLPQLRRLISQLGKSSRRSPKERKIR